MLDGRQDSYSPYTVQGQLAKLRDEGGEAKEGGWYKIPGKVDAISYTLLGFFVLCLVFLYAFNAMIG